MTPSPTLLLVYITVDQMQEARTLAQMLVEKRLAAGVNIVPGITSIYHWDGQIREHSECLLLAQTTADRFAELELAVCAKHSYVVPCIVAMPLSAASIPFAQWIEHTTQLSAGTPPSTPTSILER